MIKSAENKYLLAFQNRGWKSTGNNNEANIYYKKANEIDPHFKYGKHKCFNFKACIIISKMFWHDSKLVFPIDYVYK